jgi:uncharacterized protein
MTAPPRRIAMFPLSTVLFPFTPFSLQIFEPRYQQLLSDCLAGEREFGVVLIARGSEVGGGDQRFAMGTVARILDATPIGSGRWFVQTGGVARIRVAHWLPEEPYPLAMVEAAPEEAGSPVSAEQLERAKSLLRRTRALLSEMGEGAPLPTDVPWGDTGEVAAWRLCALAPLNALDRQRLLEIDVPSERLELLTGLLTELSDDYARVLGGG